MKITDAQLSALKLVARWGKGGAYMPFANHMRTFLACERKGLVEYRSVDNGSPYNGYALTKAGRAALGEG